MFNFKNVAILTLVLSSLLIAFSGSHATSASGGYTAAPGDGVCSQCHTDNNTSLDGDYTVTGIPASIEANTTYAVEVQLTNPSGNASRGGFQILALDATNTQGGTWSNESTGSSFKTVAGKTYLGHQGSQTFPASNELNWSADWTSPDEDDATFNFYAVSIIANGANGNQNDRFLLQQFDATIPAVATPLTLSIELVSDATCVNNADGSATVTITGGVAPYDIFWENGETTETATMLPVGNAFVIVTDATGFSTEIEIVINAPPAFEIDVVNLIDATCFGTPDGSVTVSAPDAMEPIDYEWSNGDTGNAINNVFSGSYIVTATDANGCDATLDITITEPDDFDINPTIDMPSCSGDMDGFIILNVTGGTSPYFFLWEDGSQNDSNFNLAAGTYLTTITDTNGCSTEVSTELTEPLELDISNNSLEHPLCNGDSTGVIMVTPEGGTAGYEYLWSNGATTQTISALAEGEYMLTVTDSESCSQTSTYSLTHQIDIIISTSSTLETSPFASDGTATATVISGGMMPYSYLWSTGATTAMINSLSAGSYTVTVYDTNGCSTIGVAAVSSGDCTLSAIVEVTPSTCNGTDNGSATVTLENATEPITYLWSDGSNVGNRMDLEPNTYSLIILDNAGCGDTVMNIVITEPEILTVELNLVSPNFCDGDTSGVLEAIVTGGTLDYHFAWSNEDSLAIVESLLEGNYEVTVTDINGCSASAESLVPLVDNVAPSLILQDLIVYADSSGFNEVLVTQFDNGSMDLCNGLTLSYLDNPMIGCEFLGTQSISVIGSDSLSNSDTVTVILTLLDTIAPVLVGGQLDSIALEGCEPFFFDFPVFTDNCSDTVIVEQLSGFESGQEFPAGTTDQIYSITDLSGNETIYSFTVNVTSDLMADVSFVNIDCFGESTGSISVEVSGTHDPIIQDSSVLNTALSAGGYLVTIMDTVGCQIIEIVTILEPTELIAEANTTPAATNTTTDGEIAITVTGGVEPYTITLFDANGITLAVNEDGQFSDLLSGLYNVSIIDNNGCEITIEDIEVTFATSTIDLFESYNIQTYPNPVSNQLTISIEDASANLNIYIRTIDGQQVWSGQGLNGIISVDLSDQASGLYLLSVTNQKWTTTRKISLQH